MRSGPSRAPRRRHGCFISVPKHVSATIFRRLVATASRLAVLIGSAPQVLPLAIELHEDLVHVPLQFWIGVRAPDPFPSNFGGTYRAEPALPVAQFLVAHVGATLLQRVFDVPWREGNRTYRITARRMIPAPVLTYLREPRFAKARR